MAVVRVKNGKFEILSNIISSQIKLHQKYGGVYPYLAKREHEKNLSPVYQKALKSARIQASDISHIALTIGPGLSPCLWAGINFAVSLAKELKIAIAPTNHIEGHLLSVLAKDDIEWPAVGLIVSGGHTQLILAGGLGKYEILGETRDDAAGECFDKTARIMGLKYPGGPEIAQTAKDFKGKSKIELPRPMINSKDYDFSFSGLKTATLNHFNNQKKVTKKYIANLAFEVQQAIIDVLLKKTVRAAKDFGIKTVIVSGGVSANMELKKQFGRKIKELRGVNLLVPEAKLCTDNAVMIAIAGHFSKKTKNYDKIKAQPNLRI